MSWFSAHMVDIVVISLILLSAILAFFRGFILEALSISGWLLAWFGSALVGKFVEPLVEALFHIIPGLEKLISHVLSSKTAVHVTAVIVTFLVILGVCTFVNHFLSHRVRRSGAHAIDRSFGFAFGLVRGAVLVCLAYLLVTWVWTPEEQPKWLKEAGTRSLMESGANLLQKSAPGLFEHPPKEEDAKKKKGK